MAQLVERILGKDEVGGSNPPSSSKMTCFLRKNRKNGSFFYVKLAILIWFGEHFGEQNASTA